ncbi:PIG-L deacetylase family protein [Jannaschia sp. LMIT008]|uniref:PIG-L deacetylase family protein n=1 Tax=Jannaschia maritima TaxID=3032585 RepID=UPI0028121E1B|nr:PIG-L deacetylase family protein [Jannaschia sp. LMIT008]
MPRDVLVVAAHSDDEALGCGGTIARHAGAGDRVRLLFLTDGVGARGDGGAAPRRDAARAAAAVLGAADVVQLDFPDNRIDAVPLLDVVQAIEGAAGAPDLIYTHHGGDLNVDHRICHRAVLTAFRPMSGSPVRAILGFEVASSTEWAFGTPDPFQPQHFVDIAATLDAKMRALDCYAAEMRDFPHPRSARALRALAEWRGASVGLAAAEAFTVIRQIDAGPGPNPKDDT